MSAHSEGMQLVVYGLNHRTAALDLREKVAFLPEELESALARFREPETTPEVVLLSTCNRTEIYSVTKDPDETLVEQRELIRAAKNLELAPDSTYFYRQQKCITHLFRVAAGIDSMVVGETGILGQVKSAYEAAAVHEAAGSLLQRLFTHALRVGKRARAETKIGEGAVSLAKAAVQLAGKVFGDLEGKTVLVIGSGKTGGLTAELLHQTGVRDLVFANRTQENADWLVGKYGGRSCGVADVAKEMRNADVVVSAVNVPEPILSREQAKPELDQRRRGMLLVIDLGVPRNLDPEIGKLHNVFLYAVDDLQELVNLNVDRREAEIPAVERIVLEERIRFSEWLGSLETAPVVVALREQAEQMRRETLERVGRGLSPRERELLERFSVGFMNKLLHPPTVSVRDLDPSTHEGLSRLLWTRRVFGLDDEPGRNGAEGDD